MASWRTGPNQPSTTGSTWPEVTFLLGAQRCPRDTGSACLLPGACQLVAQRWDQGLAAVRWG